MSRHAPQPSSESTITRGPQPSQASRFLDTRSSKFPSVAECGQKLAATCCHGRVMHTVDFASTSSKALIRTLLPQIIRRPPDSQTHHCTDSRRLTDSLTSASKCPRTTRIHEKLFESSEKRYVKSNHARKHTPIMPASLSNSINHRLVGHEWPSSGTDATSEFIFLFSDSTKQKRQVQQ